MEQVTTCGDVMAQDYLMDCIIQVNIVNAFVLTSNEAVDDSKAMYHFYNCSSFIAVLIALVDPLLSEHLCGVSSELHTSNRTHTMTKYSNGTIR